MIVMATVGIVDLAKWILDDTCLVLSYFQTGLENYTQILNVEGEIPKAVIKDYYSQVNCNLLIDIYKIYKIDFELFEYVDLPFYLSICKQSEDQSEYNK